jgi:hypothetical protein
MFGARKIDPASAARLRALARQRTPAWAQAELAAQEAGFQREAAIHKQQSQSNALRWYAARKALGSGR